MKNKIFYTAIAYVLIIISLIFLLSGCRSKKIIAQTNKTESVNVDSKVDKNVEVIKKEETKGIEKQNKRTESNLNDNSKIEESAEKVTIIEEDISGNKKTTIYENPVKIIQNNKEEEHKSDFQELKESVVRSSEEGKKKVDSIIQTNLNKTQNQKIEESLKSKEPFWLYVFLFVVGLFAFLTIIYFLKRYKIW